MKFKLLYILISILSFSTSLAQTTNSKSLEINKNWWMKEKNDSLASTDFIKLFNQIATNSKKIKKEVIVAVLDSDIDIYHENFKDFLWLNKKEESNDSVDNDDNGYVDDVHGWNFLGKKKDGSSLEYTLIEETRILRKFSEKEITKLKEQKKVFFSYDSVKKSYDKIDKTLKEEIGPYKAAEPGYVFCMDTLKKAFQKKQLTLHNINALKSKDTLLKTCISYVKKMHEDGYPYKEFIDFLNHKRNSLTSCLNLDYDNREQIGDDIYDINDTKYGSPLFSSVTHKIDHGTEVSGVIISALQDIKETHEVFMPIKIMPLCITGIGDPTDKDTALAIRYAVDNGAKVINLSQTKSFSINKEFVDNALRYAEKKDVLIVKSAGNEGVNLDRVVRFPNDNNKLGRELVDNMIVVGGCTKFTDKSIFTGNYNYGKKNVDIFAPSKKISTFSPNNNYTESSGTSYAAPIVSAIAAIIRSYYPSLSAKQVKQILMDSGTSYEVNIPFSQEDGAEKLIPFSELSKSGKVVNAYNAFMMAKNFVER
ncbi:S8 family serine peptidase [uncultured Tenacibaculum sp.]|uniref:S8 family serine peptidase n=1 Tax=uncultured Tenacibaculum sp. TaxID=174713 RepID=UPI002608D1AD|nr:S8 family serine peptidase [uncultured Tenacibaculum sp.]